MAIGRPLSFGPGALAALVLAAAPLAALADGVNFTVPLHYLVESPRAQVPLSIYRVWARSVGGVRHSIVVSSSAASGDLPSLMDATVASLKARNAIGVTRSDAAPLCGMPSVRIAYAFPNQLSYVFRYTIVGGRLLIASYAHPVGTEPDPTALAALDTLCSGIHQPATPPGWTLETPFPPNANAWHSASESRALLMQVASAAKSGQGLGAQPFTGKGSVVSDRTEACGAVWVRRTTSNLDDGRTLESAAGTVNGYDYVVAYTRPSSQAADAAALATLTSFCAGTLPPS